MRGKVLHRLLCIHELGITPAYAGKRPVFQMPGCPCRDHPRLCGEKFVLLWQCRCRIGSPPPMRGKVHAAFPSSFHLRITPAYAGKRFPYRYLGFYSQDHPRLCGEKHPQIFIQALETGSPPPMRGKVQAFLLWVLAVRITPAYAGKSRR